MIRAYGISETGPVRSANEDCFATAEDLDLFVVADGMGGHRAGHVAARLAVDAIVWFIRRSREDPGLPWPFGRDPGLSEEANRLRNALCLANRRVRRTADGHPSYAGMGTTVVSALFSPGAVVVGHAGDSRVYVHEHDALVQLTEDDSWLAMALRGRPQELDALRRHPLRSVLTSAIGAQHDPQLHIAERPLNGAATFLLCTDGLHAVLDAPTLGAILDAERDPAQLPRRLVDEALARGTRDNVTALVIRYEADASAAVVGV